MPTRSTTPGAAEAPHRLQLAVQYACSADGLPARSQLRRWARAALAADAALTLRIVDAEEGRALNRDFRGKDAATNVLTFVYSEAGATMYEGDLVLCHPVVCAEAAAQGKPLADHYAHLVVHGMLHLQGMDHQREPEATAMEALERAILSRLRVPDPYAD